MLLTWAMDALMDRKVCGLTTLPAPRAAIPVAASSGTFSWLFTGLDHAVGEVVMADAVEHDHVQRADALDVLGPWLIGMGIETGRDQWHHVGLVADDIGHVAVVRVQGDADTQALGRVGVGLGGQQERREQQGQEQATAAEQG